MIARLLGTLVISCFGLCMLPVLVLAYVILAFAEWSNGMLHLWKEEIDHWGKP